MPTAAKGYYTADGKRVPSVTTILGAFKSNVDGLLWWAWNEGREGRDFRETSKKACDAGTLAHDAVEHWIHGKKFPWAYHRPLVDAEVFDKAKTAFSAFKEWAKQSKIKVEQTEVQLVSEKHRFGGCFDGITRAGKRAILDWKSSNGIYPDYLKQIRAYGALWDEHHPDDPITDGYHLIRFDKQYGDFHAHYWQNLDSAWDSFLLLRQLYEIEKELRARSK
jgi:hypothetical protein